VDRREVRRPTNRGGHRQPVDLSVCEQLAQRYNLGREDLNWKHVFAFDYKLSLDISKLRWMLDTFGNPKRSVAARLFGKVSGADSMRLLVERFQLAAEPVPEAVARSARYQLHDFDSAVWVLETLGKHVPRESITSLFDRLCCDGYTAEAQWIDREYKITREEVLQQEYPSVYGPFFQGKVATIEWLVERFQMKKAEIVVVEHIGMTQSVNDQAKDPGGMRKLACNEWFIRHFRLDNDDALLWGSTASFSDRHRDFIAAWAYEGLACP
jgi:hypothetical protein